MRKLRVGIVDLVTHAPTKSTWARVMFANFCSVMPQAVAVWCEQGGHEVTYVCYTGFEDLTLELADDVDLVIIGAFTTAAHLAYSLSNLFRARGAITALGGPHARSYPQDAANYFDYVLGFTDKAQIQNLLNDCSEHRPLGLHLKADKQPAELPSVRDRWRFIESNLDKAPLLKVIQMIGSLGCPYTCSFCMDSVVPYQPLDFDTIRDDLRFLLTKMKRPHVGWLDPNFGVRFDDYMSTIEEAAPPDSIDFFAESSLSLLSEENLKRLKRNGFKVIMPGVESWYDLGNKSKTGKKSGMDKVQQVADHINLILSYIPYLQANFVVGLDVDEGREPFELTKRFVDLSPGSYPAYSLLSAFGQSAPLNLEYQKADRVLPFPFHFLNTQHAMNVRPLNYEWPEFYKNLIDLTEYTHSKRAIYRRFRANKQWSWRLMNLLRGVTDQGIGRAKFYRDIMNRLNTDIRFRDFFEQETDNIPQYYIDSLKNALGPLWEWLPQESIYHDPYVYRKEQEQMAARQNEIFNTAE
ncbi:radical SAM protein [bacterium]|nr:radical SAM protein [bacterium]